MNTLKRLLNKRISVFLLLMGCGFIVAILSPSTAIGSGGLNFKFSSDALNLFTVTCGVVTLWQVLSSAIEGMRREIDSRLEGAQKKSDERDRYHDEQIASIKARIEAIALSHEHHQVSLGHTGSLEFLYKIQQELSDVKASVAAITRQGEVLLKLEEFETQILQIFEKVEAFETQILQVLDRSIAQEHTPS